jgi:hypothetical protein
MAPEKRWKNYGREKTPKSEVERNEARLRIELESALLELPIAPGIVAIRAGDLLLSLTAKAQWVI